MSDNEHTRYIAVHQFVFKDELNDKRDPPQVLAPGSVIPPGFFTSNGKHDQAYADRLLKSGAIKHYDQGKKEADAIAEAQAAIDADTPEAGGDGFEDEGGAGEAADGSNVNEAKGGVAENAENAGKAGKSVESTAAKPGKAAKSSDKKK